MKSVSGCLSCIDCGLTDCPTVVLTPFSILPFSCKQLGIPNTKHFHGITKIQDAKDLWESLQSKLESDRFDTSKDEEYEDSKGAYFARVFQVSALPTLDTHRNFFFAQEMYCRGQPTKIWLGKGYFEKKVLLWTMHCN